MRKMPGVSRTDGEGPFRRDESAKRGKRSRMGEHPTVQELERELAALRVEYSASQNPTELARISERFSELDSKIRKIDSDSVVDPIDSKKDRVDSSTSKRDAIAEFEALLSKPSPAIERALHSLDAPGGKPANGQKKNLTPPSSKSAMELLEEMLATPTRRSSSEKTSKPLQEEASENKVASAGGAEINTPDIEDGAVDVEDDTVEVLPVDDTEDETAQALETPSEEVAVFTNMDLPLPDTEDSEDTSDYDPADFVTPIEDYDEVVPTPVPDDIAEAEAESQATEEAETADTLPPPDAEPDYPLTPLERMPTPMSDKPLPPDPHPLDALDEIEDESSATDDDTDPDTIIQKAKHSIKAALAHVRESVINLETPPSKPDAENRKSTPTVLNECLTDKMPESISEALPKFESGPEMRTCSRCGHGTALEHEKCAKCGAIDLSLGVLDYVIAGDVAKVGQILTARPQVIATRTSKHGWTLLHMAASGGNAGMAELLLERGVDVDMPNAQGKTALHYAAGKGHTAVVDKLIHYGAEVNVQYNGKTPLDLAKRAGHAGIVTTLSEAASKP